MKYLLLFSALIATGKSTNALTCKCSTADCKTGECTLEANKGKCYAASSEIFYDKGTAAKATVTGCQADTTLCDQKNIVLSSAKGFYLMTSNQCCDGKDSCNLDVNPPIPNYSEFTKTLSKKKLFCPSCFAANAKACDAQPMNCSETQNKCFDISGTVTPKDSAATPFVAKGCAVESTIVKDKATFTFPDASYTFDTVRMSDAKSGASQISGGLSFAILLPSVLWFLLDRTPY